MKEDNAFMVVVIKPIIQSNDNDVIISNKQKKYDRRLCIPYVIIINIVKNIWVKLGLFFILQHMNFIIMYI